MSEEKSSKADALISSDTILSDELLEKILSVLPLASIINSTLVSKRWHAVVQRPWSVIPPPQEAWLFLSTETSALMHASAYNPNLRRLFTFDSSFITTRGVDSSGGLVTFLDKTGLVLVYNPITNQRLWLPRVPSLSSMFRSKVAMSVDLQTKSYTVVVVNYKKDHRTFSLHVYESNTRMWLAVLKQSVEYDYLSKKILICNGVLYCLRYIYSNGQKRCCLFPLYDMMARTQPKSLLPIEVVMPSEMQFPRVMNLREKLVIVGGVAKKGLRISVFVESMWKEVAWMPEEMIIERLGIGSIFYSYFHCCGAGDFIFIQYNGLRAVLIFNMAQMQWQWSKFPMWTYNSYFSSFGAFCFEPNLKMKC